MRIAWLLLASCGGGGDVSDEVDDDASDAVSDTEVQTIDTACEDELASGYTWLTDQAVQDAGEEDEGPWASVVCDPDPGASCLGYDDLMKEDSSGDWDGNTTFTAFLDAVSPPAEGRYWWIEDLVAGPEDLCEVRCCYAVDAWLRSGERPP